MEKIYSVGTKKRYDFFELWYQDKISDKKVRLNLMFTMTDIKINSNLDPLTEFSSSRRSTGFKVSSHRTSLQ